MILMFLAAFTTSIISAVTGMAGGVVLLSLMTLILPIKVVIPIHGIIQLTSNSLRTFYLRTHLKKELIFYYIFGVPFGALISVFLLKNYLSDQFLYILLITLITYSIFKPKKLPGLKIKEKTWFFVGICTGILAIMIGSVGPFLAAFYVRDDLKKEEIVSNKAFMQMCSHLIKIPSFLYLGFNYQENVNLIILMIIGALIGTKLGVKLLGKIDDKKFSWLFKFFLSVALIRIIFKVIAAD